jgi:hypothetical protein
VVKVPYERWWQAIEESSFADAEGIFIHPVQNEQVMAGNGTIGLEILEDLPEADVVFIPFGGGGLSVGIASAVKALRPETNVYAVEPETGAPLTASLAAGESLTVDYEPSFVDGSGSPALLPKMWELARGVLDGAVAVPIDETAAAVRLLAERARVVAEGAGALSLAAVLPVTAGPETRLRHPAETSTPQADDDPRRRDARRRLGIGGAIGNPAAHLSRVAEVTLLCRRPRRGRCGDNGIVSRPADLSAGPASTVPAGWRGRLARATKANDVEAAARPKGPGDAAS